MKNMTKEFYLLVNPISGSKKGSKTFTQVKDKLEKQNIPYFCEISHYSGEMPQLAQSMANKIKGNSEKILLVIGGDGSLNQALNGVKNSNYPDTPIAYLPSGTGDDFAKAVNLSDNFSKVIDKLINHPEITKIDCIYYHDLNRDEYHYFVNNLGIGFDAYVVAQSNNSKLRDRLNRLNIGNLTYGANIIKALAHQETFEATVTVNHKLHHFNDAYLVTTTNHPYFGGGVPILPIAKPYSHKLYTVVVEKPSTMKFIYLFIKLLRNGSHMKDPHFHYFEAENISVRTKSLQFGQLDGEELGSRNFDLDFSISDFNLLH